MTLVLSPPHSTRLIESRNLIFGTAQQPRLLTGLPKSRSHGVKIHFSSKHCQRVFCCKAEAEKMTTSQSQKPEKQKILTLPTVLTLARVICIPVLVAAWFGSERSAFWTTAIFLAASITDFLDGYLARKMGTHSPFGAFLDPVADKLMVSTVLILLCSQPVAGGVFAGNAWLIPTLSSAIIGREIAMSALREWAAATSEEAHKAAAVSSLGKLKTTTQMVSLTLLLASSGPVQTSYTDLSGTIGMPLLFVAAFLTVFSLYQYITGLWKYLF